MHLELLFFLFLSDAGLFYICAYTPEEASKHEGKEWYENRWKQKITQSKHAAMFISSNMDHK